ncbi:prepilin peptidase [Methermicoccus shengliensis]|uniref:Prepilin peptidase n=1 Tax=Methermicoccus shengliensis TaxID=660064 RepID=A0A832W0E5_9EURY|nr:A24 family peptidase [Methermicoccus shengliensis]KUK04754.1 MAG: hypothetical protein XD46_0455 [Euryarchaeota archaeon 55_53]KUK29914.1 MAG: hypothetical protein XD62_0981 [Methanosarcinales archeaon 56_1174]MDI3487671.1 archaeal preflagellin peptidase FlaK [Methanosarcinales archaeon]MDN5295565.1 archaeal preflagellin peptidase FlaK [Methanosarcinales archaeon]HIH70324.1 prepilin peptidase [Methermicoccus shengliensis]
MEPVLILTLAVFSYAAYTDLKTRTVSNRVWAVYMGLGVPLLALSGVDVGLLLMSLLIIAPAVFASYHFGGMGGADVKGMLALSVMLHHRLLAVWVVIAGSLVALVMSRKYGDNIPFMVALLVGIVLGAVLDALGVLPF